MAVLTNDRNAPRADGNIQSYPVAANTVLFAGGFVCISAATNMATRGAVATNLRAVGRAIERADNTGGAAGAIRVEAESGVFRFDNSTAGDLIVLGDVGTDCFIVDDTQVAKTNGTNTRSRAGRVINVDAQGVWVQVGPGY